MGADQLKTALVVGCAANVWDDVEKAKRLCRFDAVYCVKIAGIHWPEKFQTWISLHPEYMEKYRAERSAKGLPNGYEIVSPLESELSAEHKGHSVDRRVSYRWPGMNGSASSGIYGAKVALEDGFDRVVLAGIPMDNSKHFTRGKQWNDLASFEVGFKQALPHLLGKVRSFSGRTKELLGSPTPSWIAGEPQ